MGFEFLTCLGFEILCLEFVWNLGFWILEFVWNLGFWNLEFSVIDQQP
jgi:hypothetical protein